MLWRRTRHDPPPSTAMDAQAFLARVRPGDAVDLVCNPGRNYPLDVRRTVILDLDPTRGVVVSQPNRPLMKTAGLPPLEATVVLRNRDRETFTRWGFDTTIEAVIADFPLSGSTQEAVVLAPPTEVHDANLRAGFRVTIPVDLTPPLTLVEGPQAPHGMPADLINLSTGGALVTYRRALGSLPLCDGGETIVLQADLNTLLEHLAVRLYTAQAELARFQVRCRVVHTRQEADRSRHNLGLAFTDLTRPQEDLLHAIILKLQLSAVSKWLM